MAVQREVFQSVTTYKLVLRKMAMIFPMYDDVFDLPSADYGRQKREVTNPDRLEEVRELDYGRVDTVDAVKNRSVTSSVKIIAFALSAIFVAFVFESKFHLF